MMIDKSGSKIQLKIRRMRCEKCERLHHELPDCVVPYKRHCAETIEEVISGSTREVPCSDDVISKIRKWWNKVSLYFTGILRSIEEKLKIRYEPVPSMRETIQAIVNSHNWVMASSI